MNLQQSAKDRADELTADRLAVEKFAVGQSVPRTEDPMLLRGKGHYTDDVSLPGQAYAVMVRSQNAHGIIRAIDTRGGAKMPGVLGVYTGRRSEGLRPAQMRRAVQQSRRHADEEAAARSAGEGQGALCRRPGRLRRRRDVAASEGCGRSGQSSISSRCRRSPRPKTPRATARRCFTTTCRATSRSTITSATPRR